MKQPHQQHMQQNQQPPNQPPQQHQNPSQHQQGSRLNQWKLNIPNIDNEDAMGIIGNDFVRAPGKPSQSSPNLNPLLSGSNR